VIYRVVRDEIQVFILYGGLRKQGSRDDVYELAKKLVRSFFSRIGCYSHTPCISSLDQASFFSRFSGTA
jgi:hypothetical protein